MPKKPIVLIIEDDPFIREIYATQLTAENIEVKIAKNGLEGVEKVKTIKPDLVLLDLMLPEISGFEVLTRLKQDSNIAEIPVIILSNLGQEADKERALKLGAIEYLVKTDCTIDQLIQKIKEFIFSPLVLEKAKEKAAEREKMRPIQKKIGQEEKEKVTKKGMINEFSKLAELHQTGELTDEEFEEAKKKILE